VPAKPVIAGEKASVTCQSRTALKTAKLNYTTDTGLRSKRKWTSVPATIQGNVITSPKPPAEANSWFFTIWDERDAMVSTEVVLLP
jgi:hypothetical protein